MSVVVIELHRQITAMVAGINGMVVLSTEARAAFSQIHFASEPNHLQCYEDFSEL